MSFDQAPSSSTQWQPPVPSLASLPVDKTKTEPTPAYYKLQFGDEVTGFSYYVRTLRVIIGRNTASPAAEWVMWQRADCRNGRYRPMSGSKGCRRILHLMSTWD